MTMQLMPAYVTTNRSGKKRKKTNTNDPAYQKLLKKYGFETGPKKKAAPKKLGKLFAGTVAQDHREMYPSGEGVGVAFARKEQVYTGERKLLGVAVMHKSNLVPVFSQEDAEDIAKMRRG